jgi:hypothetical protein
LASSALGDTARFLRTLSKSDLRVVVGCLEPGMTAALAHAAGADVFTKTAADVIAAFEASVS